MPGAASEDGAAAAAEVMGHRSGMERGRAGWTRGAVVAIGAGAAEIGRAHV